MSIRKYTPVKLTERQLEIRQVRRGFRITIPGAYYQFYITESFDGGLNVGDADFRNGYDLDFMRDNYPGTYSSTLLPYLKRNGYATT